MTAAAAAVARAAHSRVSTRAPRTACATPPAIPGASRPGGGPGLTRTSASSPGAWSSSTSTVMAARRRSPGSRPLTRRCRPRLSAPRLAAATCTSTPVLARSPTPSRSSASAWTSAAAAATRSLRPAGTPPGRGTAGAPRDPPRRCRVGSPSSSRPLLPRARAALIRLAPTRAIARGATSPRRCAASSVTSRAPSPAPATTRSTAPPFASRSSLPAATGTLAALPAPLLDAALAAGLSESEALATIASGLRAGHQHPRPAGP